MSASTVQPLVQAHIQAMQAKARSTGRALKEALPAAQKLQRVLADALLGQASLEDVEAAQQDLDTTLMHAVNDYGDIQTCMDAIRILKETLAGELEPAPMEH